MGSRASAYYVVAAHETVELEEVTGEGHHAVGFERTRLAGRRGRPQGREATAGGLPSAVTRFADFAELCSGAPLRVPFSHSLRSVQLFLPPARLHERGEVVALAERLESLFGSTCLAPTTQAN